MNAIKKEVTQKLCTSRPETVFEKCKKKEIDITFLIDSSGSIPEDDFIKMKDFVKSIITPVDVQAPYTRIGLATFESSTSVQQTWTFDRQTALSTLDAIPHTKGGTKLGKALNIVRNEFFNDRRPLANSVLVVLTDGKSSDSVQANADKLRALGVTIFAIGINQPSNPNAIDQVQLSQIADSSNYMYVTPSFDALNAISKEFTEKICDDPGSEVIQQCKAVEMELVFLIDGSKSVKWYNFNDAREFLGDVDQQTDFMCEEE